MPPPTDESAPLFPRPDLWDRHERAKSQRFADAQWFSRRFRDPAQKHRVFDRLIELEADRTRALRRLVRWRRWAELNALLEHEDPRWPAWLADWRHMGPDDVEPALDGRAARGES